MVDADFLPFSNESKITGDRDANVYRKSVEYQSATCPNKHKLPMRVHFPANYLVKRGKIPIQHKSH